jgi:hypothetical protein
MVMAGPDGGGGEEQVPGNSGLPSGPIDEALGLGGQRAAYLGREQEIAESLGGLTAERTALETAHQVELARLEDELHGDLGKLGDRRVELESERDTLTANRQTTERKMKRLGGRIRSLADTGDAPRGDQLAFAAYATGDLSPLGLEHLVAVDELVRQEHGQLFVVSQGQHLAFGRIKPDNTGLLINTEQQRRGRDSIRRVHLPVQLYPVRDEDGVTSEVPQYGWVSGGFDDEYREEYRRDYIEDRGPADSELLGAGSGTAPLGHFILSQANLYLPSPTKLHIADETTDEKVFAEQALGNEGDDIIVAGIRAEAYLHRFLDHRLAEVRDKLDEDDADVALSRAIRAARKTGVVIDMSQLFSLDTDFAESDS